MGKLAGDLFDIWKQGPLENATVRIAEAPFATATTDQRGAFELAHVSLGDHTLEILYQGEKFIVPHVGVEANHTMAVRLGLPTRAATEAMNKECEEEGLRLAQGTGWSAIPSGVLRRPRTERVLDAWHDLGARYRAATDRYRSMHSLAAFADVVPGASRFAALLSFMQHRGDFEASRGEGMESIAPGELLARMIESMEVVEVRPSETFPFGVDVFLADDRFAPVRDRKHLNRKDNAAVLVSQLDDKLVVASISPAMADGLERLSTSILMTGSPGTAIDSDDESSPAATKHHRTLFDQLAETYRFDDFICPSCEDLLTPALLAKHLPSSRRSEKDQHNALCSPRCERTMGLETIVLVAECGMKNEFAKKYDSDRRRMIDGPVIDTFSQSSGSHQTVGVIISDNDTPCAFRIVRSGPAQSDLKMSPSREKQTLELAKDIATLATPQLMTKKPRRSAKP